MLSSRSTTAKVSFNIGIELDSFDGKLPIHPPIEQDYQVDTWGVAPVHRSQHFELIGPSFDFADVAAGLPDVEAAVDAVRQDGSSYLEKTRGVAVRVGIQGGISSGETTLLTKKIATLVMLLEEHLLTNLTRARSRKHYLVSMESQVAKGPWPQGNVVSSYYDSHVPPMATIKPGSWCNEKLESMYLNFRLIWSAPSLWELDHLLLRSFSPPTVCDFFMLSPREVLVGVLPWALEENPQDPEPWWNLEELGKLFQPYSERDPEDGYTYLYFTYLQPTLDHTLLRNWVEIIAGIVKLALASPDEYKQCLETILTIVYDYDRGEEAWVLLMKRVLELEHRIPYWRKSLE